MSLRSSKQLLLNENFFKSNNEFKSQWETLAGEDEGDPQDPWDDEDFLDSCYQHACYYGRGFAKWMYLGSLSDEIKKQVASVQNGDLLDLMRQVDISIKHFEMFDSTELELEYSKTTMADTNNDPSYS